MSHYVIVVLSTGCVILHLFNILLYLPPHQPAHTSIHTHAWNNSPWQQGSVAFMHTNLSYHSNYLEPDSFQSTNPPPSPFSYWLNEAATWSSRKAKSTPFDFMVALPSLCCRRPPSHRHTEVVSEHVTSFRSLSPNNPCDYQLTGAATGGIINLPHMFAVPPCLFVILIRLRIETYLTCYPPDPQPTPITQSEYLQSVPLFHHRSPFWLPRPRVLSQVMLSDLQTVSDCAVR